MAKIATQQAVVVARVGEEIEVYGPFANGEEASRWGFNNLSVPACDSWFWQDLIHPASPYASRAEPLLDRG